MWKKILIVAGALLLISGLIVAVALIQKSRARKALRAYVAELKARGEPLTWKDLGYPPEGATNTSVQPFLSAVGKLGWARPHPSELVYMKFVGPGVAEASWAAPSPLVRPFGRPPRTNATTWAQFVSDMVAASNTLAEIRAWLETPPRYSAMNLTNPLAPLPKNCFVQERAAAQWLAADSVAALHQDDLDRARASLHGLTQLVKLHQDDVTLVNAMIRVAVSGLGLSATWEALQHDNWDEQALAQLQRDWEDIDLTDPLEKGVLGERIWLLWFFENPDLVPANFQAGPSAGAGQGLAGFRDDVLAGLSTAYWRGNIEADELLYLQLNQNRLDLLRQLKTNAPGVRVTKAMRSQEEAAQAELSGLLTRYRHLLTSIAVPAYSRAVATLLRTETERRMTITAIALRRFKLRNGRIPQTLQELVAEFRSAVPIDPMSGQPFGYRTNADGSFTLWSVGEDGTDDGGDATSTNASGNFDLWDGRDAVWPKAAIPDENPR